ncbi:hypothetical protein ACQEU6_02605 [Spirillospora sp. CA-108201]
MEGGPEPESSAAEGRTCTCPAPLGDSGATSPHALKSLSETDGTTDTTDLYTCDEVGNTITRAGLRLRGRAVDATPIRFDHPVPMISTPPHLTRRAGRTRTLKPVTEDGRIERSVGLQRSTA